MLHCQRLVVLQIIARVSVSPLPVHIYVVNPTREVWTHSDTDGTFDVIAVADIAAGDVTSLNATNVPVSLNKATEQELLSTCKVAFVESIDC